MLRISGKEKGKKALPAPGEYALALLSAKAYSVQEVRAKLRKKGFSPQETEETLSGLVRKGFLNDASFARMLADSLYGAGYGKKRISLKLRAKGISPELIHETLREEEEPAASGTEGEKESCTKEKSSAEKALQGRMRTLRNEPDPRKRREKALRFLAGRGFDVQTCFATVDKFLGKASESDFFS